MVPLRTEIQSETVEVDGRRAVRRTLRLPVAALAAGDVANAIVHNLSETGLLVETDAEVRIGETICIDLPDAGASAAVVVRKDGRLVGCAFVSPLSKGVVSAAQLMTPVAEPSPAEGETSDYGSSEWRYDVGHQLNDEQTSMTIVVVVGMLIALIATILFVSALRAPMFG